MVYNISTINNLPYLSGYYFFLLGKKGYTYGQSGDALFYKFDELAERIGANSVIIQSFRSSTISDELVKCIEKSHGLERCILHFTIHSQLL